MSELDKNLAASSSRIHLIEPDMSNSAEEPHERPCELPSNNLDMDEGGGIRGEGWEGRMEAQELVTPEASPPPEGWYQQARPWIIAPTEWRQWLTFLLLWGCILGGLIALVVWALPKIIDNFVIPATNSIEAGCTPAQIGLIVISGATVTHLLFVPRSPFLWLAALVFSFPIALALTEISQVIIITVGFFVGRTLLQRRALSLMDRWKYAKAAQLSIKDAGQFRVILLLQLSPFPSEISQYIIGLPVEVTFWPAFAASMLGSLPGNVLTLVFGRNLQSISAILSGNFASIPAAQLVVDFVSVLSAVVFVIAASIYARRALRRIEASSTTSSET